MDFKAFDKTKLDEYAAKAKAEWGNTPEYAEFEKKSKNRNSKEDQLMAERFMLLFKEAGTIRESDPAGDKAQDLVRRIQQFITDNMYNCTKDILKGLGQMYSAGGEFTDNIDAAGGEGTANFVSEAIAVYCK